jgi:hypothetical protein
VHAAYSLDDDVTDSVNEEVVEMVDRGDEVVPKHTYLGGCENIKMRCIEQHE